MKKSKDKTKEERKSKSFKTKEWDIIKEHKREK